jgi:predicted GH43/DUF377 family glycosyl hydrolase
MRKTYFLTFILAVSLLTAMIRSRNSPDISSESGDFHKSKNTYSAGVKNIIDSLNIGALVQPVPLKNKFTDEEYNIWGGSVTRGKNGKYYMLYSRWPKVDGHYAWVIKSEIAVAVSDHPGGPFKHLKVALPARGNQFWDGTTTHNPAVMQYKGKYYLFYMGTTGKSDPSRPYSMKDDDWWEYRNNQRISVAVANDLEGDWKRLDKPVLDVSPDEAAFDALLVSNPAATFDQNGRVILIYKAVENNNSLHGGKVRFGVAFAASPTGPFEKEPDPIFEVREGANDWMVAEDPYIWHQDNIFFAIVRDVIGKFTGDAGALALLVSRNGKQWDPAKYPKVIGSRFVWEDGTKSIGQLERPCLLRENCIPRFLYGAYGLDKSRNSSCNVAVPLKNN